MEPCGAETKPSGPAEAVDPAVSVAEFQLARQKLRKALQQRLGEEVNPRFDNQVLPESAPSVALGFGAPPTQLGPTGLVRQLDHALTHSSCSWGMPPKALGRPPKSPPTDLSGGRRAVPDTLLARDDAGAGMHSPGWYTDLMSGNTLKPEAMKELLSKLDLNTTVDQDEKHERYNKRVGWARRIHNWETQLHGQDKKAFSLLRSLLSTTAHECEEWMEYVGAEAVSSLGEQIEILEKNSGEQFQCTDANLFIDRNPDEAHFRLHGRASGQEWGDTKAKTGMAKIRGVMEELRMPSRTLPREVQTEMKTTIADVFGSFEVEIEGEEDLWDEAKLRAVIEECIVGDGWDPKYQIRCRDDPDALKPQLPSVREDVRAMIRQIVFRNILNRYAQVKFEDMYDIEQKKWKHPDHPRDDLTMSEIKTAGAIANKRLFDFGDITARKLEHLRASARKLELSQQVNPEMSTSDPMQHGKTQFFDELVQALPERPKNGCLDRGKKAEDFDHDYRKGVIVFLEKFEEVMTQRASKGNKDPTAIFQSQSLPSFLKVGKGLTLSYNCETNLDALLRNRGSDRRSDSMADISAQDGDKPRKIEQAVVVSSFHTLSTEVVVHEVGLSTLGLYTIQKKGGKHVLEYASLSEQEEGDGDAKSLMELLDDYETLEITVGDNASKCIFNISLNRQDWSFVGGSAESSVIRCSHRECVGPIPEGGNWCPFRRFALFVEGPLQLDQPGFMQKFKVLCNTSIFTGSAQAVRDMLCYCALSSRNIQDAVHDINILVRETDPCTASRLLYCVNSDAQQQLPQREMFAAMLSSHWRTLLSADFKEGVEVPDVPRALLHLIRGGKCDPSVLLVDVKAQEELQGYVEGRTRHEFQVMQVEPSNLEAVHTRIVECSGYGSLNILFLTLGPALSPADVCVIACASFNGSVRLIIRKTETTIAALHEHRASGKVLVVETTGVGAQHSNGKVAPKPYTEASVVGAAILAVGTALDTSFRAERQPAVIATKLRNRVLDYHACHLPAALAEKFRTPAEKSKWWEVEKEFRRSVSLSGDGEDVNVLLLVAEDPSLVRYYYETELKDVVGQPSTLDALDAEFEQKFAKYQTLGTPSAVRDLSLPNNENRQAHCVVVYQAQMLSHERKIVIVRRAVQARMLLIFVVQKLDTADLFDLLHGTQVGSSVEESGSGQGAAAHYLHARVHNSREMCLHFIRDEVAVLPMRDDDAGQSLLDLCENVFRAVRLAFGSVITLDFLKSNPDIISQIKRAYEGIRDSGNELAVQLLRVGTDLLDKGTVRIFAREIITAACDHLKKTGGAQDSDDEHSTCIDLARELMKHVTDRPVKQADWPDITFETFVAASPDLEFMEQKWRVLRYLEHLHVDINDPLIQQYRTDCSGDSNEYEPSIEESSAAESLYAKLLESRHVGNNVHHSNLLLYFQPPQQDPKPHYHSSEPFNRGRNSFSRETYRRQIVAQEELHWNRVCEDSVFATEMNFEILMHFLWISHQPIRLLASINARTLFELLDRSYVPQFRFVLFKILRCFSDSDAMHMYRTSDQLDEHIAVLKWCLCYWLHDLHVKEGTSRRIHGELDGEQFAVGFDIEEKDMDALIRMKVPLSNMGSEIRQNATYPMFGKLDRPINFLFQQVDLRQGLLSCSVESIVRALFDGASVGAALVNFAMQQSTYESVCRADPKTPLMVHPLVTALQSWKFEWLQREHQTDIFVDAAEHFAKFTTEAWACVLQAAFDQSQMEGAGQALLSAACKVWPRTLGDAISQLSTEPTLLERVIKVILTFGKSEYNDAKQRIHFAHWAGLQLRKIEDRCSAEVRQRMGSASHPTWLEGRKDEIKQAFDKGPNSSTTLYHAAMLASWDDSCAPLKDWCMQWTTQERQITCPVEDYSFVAKLYLGQDFGADDESAEIDDHLKLLSDNGWDEIRNLLLKERLRSYSDDSVDTSRHKTLLLLCWLKDPSFSMLASDTDTSSAEFTLLLRLCNCNAQFKETVRAKLNDKQFVSSLALFLCFPECLEVSTWNAFARRFDHCQYKEIGEKTYVIGQINHPRYPPYFLKLSCRSTNLDLLLNRAQVAANSRSRWPELDTLLQSEGRFTFRFDNTHKDWPLNVLRNKQQYMTSVTFQLSKGLSVSTMKDNLQALWTVTQMLLDLPEDFHTIHSDSTPLYAYHVLWAWFYAVPFHQDEINQWLKVLKPFEGDETRLSRLPGDDAAFANFTFLPFPSHIDIHVNTGACHELFGATKHDAHFTLQCLHPLLMAEQDRLEWRDPNKLLEGYILDGMSHFRCSALKAKELLELCARDVATTVATDVNANAIPVPRDGNVEINYWSVLDLLQPAGDVLHRLNNQEGDAETTALYPDLMDHFVRKLTAEFKSKVAATRHSSVREAILFRCLTSVIGISGQNHTERLHKLFVQLWSDLGLALCQSSCDELEFFDHAKPDVIRALARCTKHRIRMTNCEHKLTKENVFEQCGQRFNVGASPARPRSASEAPASPHQLVRQQSSQLSIPTAAPLFKPTSERQAESSEIDEDRNFRGEDNAEVGNTINQRDYSGEAVSVPRIFFCNSLVDARCMEGFVEVTVVPGDEITLVSRLNSSVCEFLSGINSMPKNSKATRVTRILGLYENTDESLCYRTFMSHESAWKHVCEQRAGTVAVIDGLVLHKEESGGFRPYIRTSTQPSKSIGAWDLMDANKLIALRLPPKKRDDKEVSVSSQLQHLLTPIFERIAETLGGRMMKADDEGEEWVWSWFRGLGTADAATRKKAQQLAECVWIFIKRLRLFLSSAKQTKKRERVADFVNDIRRASDGAKDLKKCKAGCDLMRPGTPEAEKLLNELMRHSRTYELIQCILVPQAGACGIEQVDRLKSDAFVNRSRYIVEHACHGVEVAEEVDESDPGVRSWSPILDDDALWSFLDEDEVSDAASDDDGDRDGASDDDDNEDAAFYRGLGVTLSTPDDSMVFESVSWRKGDFVAVGKQMSSKSCGKRHFLHSYSVGSVLGPNCNKLVFLAPSEREVRYSRRNGWPILYILHEDAFAGSKGSLQSDATSNVSHGSGEHSDDYEIQQIYELMVEHVASPEPEPEQEHGCELEPEPEPESEQESEPEPESEQESEPTRRLATTATAAAGRTTGATNSETEMKEARMKWVLDCLRAPLSAALKQRMIQILLVHGDWGKQPMHTGKKTFQTKEERVCFRALLDRCPEGYTQEKHVLEMWDSVGGQDGKELKEIVKRGGEGQYGITFVPPGFKETLAKHANFATCDLKMEYEHKSCSTSGMYLKILTQLRENDGCCFVYVSGLKTVDDTLFKWLAEYTQRNPWQFVIFEDVNTTWNLVENMDRAIKYDGLKYGGSDTAGLHLKIKSFEWFCSTPEDPRETWFVDKQGGRGKTSAYKWLSTNQSGQDSNYTLRHSTKTCDMESEIQKVIGSGGSRWVMISGDPGIGKTFYLENTVHSKFKDRYKRLDGSSDDFVRVALTQELEIVLSRFPQGKECLLVLDEYHMMSLEQKSQLLSWANKNLDKVKLVMVSNRLDETDYDLFKELGKTDAAMKNVVETRGSLRKLIEKTALRCIAGEQRSNMSLTGHSRDILLFVYLWVRSIRGLFGDEMMSMRPVPEYIKAYTECPPNGKWSPTSNSRLKVNRLVFLLQKKQPTLPTDFCRHFVDEVLDFKAKLLGRHEKLLNQQYRGLLGEGKFTDELNSGGISSVFEMLKLLAESARDMALEQLDACLGGKTAPTDSTNTRVPGTGKGMTMRLLVCASLTDSTEVHAIAHNDQDEASLSYPEFTMPRQQRAGISQLGGQKDLQPCHPVVRLAFWVEYMYSRATFLKQGDHPDETGANTRMVTCCELLRMNLQIIDLPMKFPQIFFQPERCNLKSCQVRCAVINPSEIQKMILALQRGFTVDWRTITAYWSTHPVTDWRKFSDLIDASRGAVLNEMLNAKGRTDSQQQSLRGQLRTMINLSDADKISQHCIKHKQVDVRVEDDKDPFYVSAWKAFRFCKVDTACPLGIQLQGELAPTPDSGIYPLELINTLCWASRFGYNSLDVAGSVGIREVLLRQHILLATHSLEKRMFDVGDDESTVSTAGDKILILWSHLFSDVFYSLVYSPESEFATCFSQSDASKKMFEEFVHLKKGLSYWTLLHIADSCYPPKPRWPERIQMLGHLLNGSITTEKLDELLCADCHFWEEVVVQGALGGQLPSTQNTLRQRVIRALLDPKTKLRVASQKRIIETRELKISSDHIDDFKMDEVLEKFSQVLKKEIASEEDIVVGGTAFRASLQRQYRYEQRQARND